MSSLEEMSQDTGAFSTTKAQAHLTLLRMFIAVYDSFGQMNPIANMILKNGYSPEQSQQVTDHYLRVADYRYRLYLDFLVSERHTPRDTWLLPPWDVALIMHAHMLSPLKFAHDISSHPHYSTLTGLLDLPLMRLQANMKPRNTGSKTVDQKRWRAKYPTLDYSFLMIHGSTGGLRDFNQQDPFPPLIMVQGSKYAPRRFNFEPPPPFSLDLVEAVKRQMDFSRKITAIYPYDPVPKGLLADSQERYCKFMNLIRLNATANPVPALDIDLFWHTHQLFPSNYLPWCNHHIGRSINHDDTIGEGELTNGLQETVIAWETNYSEDYLNPSPRAMVQDSVARSTGDKIPPPGLTPAQLALWRFDVQHQERYEEMALNLARHKEDLAQVDREIANLPPPPSMSSAGDNGSKKGFMKRLIKVTMTDSSPRDKLLTRRTQLAAWIDGEISRAKQMQELWGMGRWPLLVAARGFGDSTVTYAKYVRAPQGTETLNFPIYPATWYDRKPLDYYDYITGGPEGAGKIEGGGIPLGGAKCGGHFDGGNCAAMIVRNNLPACGGGGG